jgi:hypothetical protein
MFNDTFRLRVYEFIEAKQGNDVFQPKKINTKKSAFAIQFDSNIATDVSTSFSDFT